MYSQYKVSVKAHTSFLMVVTSPALEALSRSLSHWLVVPGNTW